MELTKNQQFCHFEVSSTLTLCNNNEQFLSWIVTLTKSGFYATGDDQFGGWTKKKLQGTSQSQTCTKNRLWSLFGGGAGLIHYSFLNPEKNITFENYAQQINKMPQNLKCLQLALVSKKSPILQESADLILHNQCFKAWTNWAMKFCFTHHIHQTSHQLLGASTWRSGYHFFKHLYNFLQGKCFHSQQEAENAFQEFVRCWSMDFYATGINKHFLLAKICWL